MTLATMQRDLRAWLVDGSQEAAERFGPQAAPGLDIYQNNYRAQLMACMEESFAQVHAWLGDAAFHAAAATHIDRSPPAAWTLDAYGRDFPETLDALYPNDPEIADLALLELALAKAFVGPDAAPLSRDDLADVDWDHARLQLVPTAELCLMRSNAPAIWSALSAREEPPAAVMLPEPSAVIVWRSGFVSCFRTLESHEEAAIRAIRDGRRFADICARLVDERGETEGVAAAGVLLGRWLSEQMLRAF